MGVSSRIHQLRINAHTIRNALDAAFEQMRHAEFFSDLVQVARDPALVLHYRSAADYFQVRDFRKVG